MTFNPFFCRAGAADIPAWSELAGRYFNAQGCRLLRFLCRASAADISAVPSL